MLWRPFPVLFWLFKRMPRSYGSLLRETFKNYFLFYASNKLFRGYNSIVVHGYAVDSNANKELCEVWQIRGSFTAYRDGAAVLVRHLDKVSDYPLHRRVSFIEVSHLT